MGVDSESALSPLVYHHHASHARCLPPTHGPEQITRSTVWSTVTMCSVFSSPAVLQVDSPYASPRATRERLGAKKRRWRGTMVRRDAQHFGGSQSLTFSTERVRSFLGCLKYLACGVSATVATVIGRHHDAISPLLPSERPSVQLKSVQLQEGELGRVETTCCGDHGAL